MYAQYQEEIASQYCENRFAQNNKECKGKCYLNKQIEIENSTQNSNHFTLSKLKTEIFLQDIPIIKILFKQNFFRIIEIYLLKITNSFSTIHSPPPELKNLV